MSNRLDDIIKRVIDRLFAPVDLIRPSVLSNPILFLIAGILIVTVIVAAPPLRPMVAESWFHVACLRPATKEAGKEYCDFVVIVFTLLIAFTIGGIIITDRIAAFTRSVASAFERSREAGISLQQTELKNEILAIYLRIKESRNNITIWNFPIIAIRVYIDINELLMLTMQRVPFFIIFILVVRFGVSFPNGFHGVVSLLVFEGLLLAQVSKTYFEYLPTCTS